MGVDLPAGTWSAALVGPWWPAPSTALRAGAQHWSEACAEQQAYSQTLRTQWTLFAAHNQGHTADDLIDRFRQGEKFHLDLAEKYQAKASAFNSAADANDYLRSRLSEIASTGNREINDILASKKLPPEKLAEIQAVQVRCNADAANASRDSVDKMMAATQKILDADGAGVDARSWAQANGFKTEDPTPPSPISEKDLESPHGTSQQFGGKGVGESSHGGTGAQASPAVFGGKGVGESSHGGTGTQASPAVFGGGGSGGGQGPSAEGTSASQTIFGGVGGHGGHVPSGGGATPSAPLGMQMPTTSGTVPSGVPGVHGAPTAMAPSGLGLGPGGQPNLAQSFASGLATGQATGPGGQAFSANALQAMETGAPQTPAGTPPVAPTVPSAGAFIAATPPVDAPPAAAPAPSAAGGAAPVAPAVMTGGSWSSAATGGPSVPSGSLPAYGSDLRPPVVAAPSVPSAPTGPVSGAPVAPSPASSPSAGGTLVSPVERSAASAAAGQAGAGSSTLANASAVSAAAGATAGAASSRAAEQQRLQRLVDAVARQEPRLSWAAGLRDDGTTTLLVTDLASGWIPPHVRLPAHVTLLEPTARRHDANVVDLLGAVTVAAAHHANTYVAEPGSDEPTLSGDRPARSAAPQVDELGPTLVDAVRRRDGLPRIAQAVAAPAVRKTGVLESEIRMLRECTAEIQHAVLTAYPHHDPAAVGDWMLLAAIQALIDGHEYLAHYHLAWFQAINHRAGS
ncbi:DUF5631 domain-containing protein [Mycobacterium avium subsp. hominissuis]|nr:DUF5631 domain-containing protein [Mycobacterium avium subsp. hominissuis]MDV3273142.1 DUF5631 domain-containing protein [Mycobacterium avium subsp. hominissuis]MDV3320548.1 DUF5631 domain-containing protein [Mycobacterium avium subsp. hominissuis]